MAAIPAATFDSDEVALRIWFDDGTNGVQQLSPDHPLTSAPYAFRSAKADFAATAAPGAGALIGEIRIWAGSISAIPSGWLHCDGSEKGRAVYAKLFAVVGEIYGPGNGTTTFNLPDLRDRSPMGATQDDAGVPKTNVTGALTQTGGAGSHTLTVAQIPSHTHTLRAQSGTANNCDPVGNVLADFCAFGAGPFHTSAANSNMDSSSITNTGGGQAHPILDPYLAITFIIYAGQ
jgi:microcystin-dependent protein